MEKNLTEGSVLKNVVYFSLPYLLSYFLQTLYGMADLFIIGQFHGVDSTTAVSIGSQVMHMLTVMIVGLAMGSTVLIGKAVGAKDDEQVSLTVGNTATLFMVISVVSTAVLIFAVKPIVSVMSTPEEAVSGTVSYLTICFIGIPFITAYNVISSIFRGMGDSKSPMYFIAVSCVANIALDYFFIGALGFKASGAALGTTLSQTVSVIVSLLVIKKRGMKVKSPALRGEGFEPRDIRQISEQARPLGSLLAGIKLCPKHFKLRTNTVRNLLKIGIPVAFQDGFIQISFIVITIIANKRGLSDSAAVGIVEKIIAILFLVPSSMLSAISVLSAQNIGAGRYDRAKLTLRYACVMSVTWGIMATILMQFAAEPFVGLFVDGKSQNSSDVILLGSQYMQGYVWDCILAGIHFCFSGYFCACGLSGISFIHNSLSIICVRIPLAFWASRHFADTLFPMGLASPAGSMLSVTICICVYIWLSKRQKAFLKEG